MLNDIKNNNLKTLQFYFNKMINIHEDLYILKLNTEKNNLYIKKSRFLRKLWNKFNKLSYLLLTFALIVYLYYYYMNVRKIKNFINSIL